MATFFSLLFVKVCLCLHHSSLLWWMGLYWPSVIFITSHMEAWYHHVSLLFCFTAVKCKGFPYIFFFLLYYNSTVLASNTVKALSDMV